MLDGLTLDQLRVLVAIAETGSFRAAAGRLQRAQSAISHAIASLEAQLNVVLFDRSGYRPVLTDEGRTLLADARRVLAQTEGLKALARSFTTGIETSLDIAIDPFVDLMWVARAFHAVHEAFPEVGMRIRTMPLGGPLVAVRDRGSLFGLSVSDEIRDDALTMEAVGAVTLYAVTAPGHRLANETPPVDVSDQLNIVVSDPTDVTAGVDYGVGGPRAWRVDDLQTKRALIMAGIGWGNMPSHLVEADIAAGRLARIAPQGIGKDGATVMPVYLIHRQGAMLGPAGTCLRNAILRDT
ncbi:MAG: LysR family transcriptional regulator [Roseitalea sp.]|jgi:DNA-binding transcriptional LysR family regulator|nr:LysR family transcriptional regulator [Roseitalea sp.]MBO6720651.1 LysR family transcriptional regulator [Roseitalea sp.]MBO6743798.1 LysR family transcriptional regulator [Roseitalea sp.]